MKKIRAISTALVSALILLFCISPIDKLCCEDEAAPPKEEEKKFYEIGEKVTYTVTWSGIPAGEAVMEILPPVEINNSQAIRYLVKAYSYKAFDTIYHVANEIESLIDVETFLPYYFRKHLEQGDRKRYEFISFDREKLQAELIKTDKDGKEEKRYKTEICKDVHDPLSCFFVFRSMDLKVGESFELPVSTGRNTYVVKVEVKKKEAKHIRGVGRWMTYHVVPTYSFEGVFFHNGKVDMWVEAETKIPVFMEFELPIGYASVELKSVEYVDYSEKDEEEEE